MRVAAVDAGTNSTRLLIADWDGASLARVHVESRITRLGLGVDASGRLADEAIDATLRAMADYRDRIAVSGVERTVAVATSAARDAANGEEFLARATAAATPLRILTGDQEATLAFAGATLGVPGDEHLVIDVGGGSTELVVGGGAAVRAAISLDLGCVRLAERYLHSDPPTPDELAALAAEVDSMVRTAAPDLPALPSRGIAVGGTATTLAAIRHGLARYDADVVDMTEMLPSELRELRDRLAVMPVAEIAGMPVVQRGRADVLVGGAALLSAVVDALGLEGVTVRDHDILDGLALLAAGEVVL